jgi:hypothetical protein
MKKDRGIFRQESSKETGVKTKPLCRTLRLGRRGRNHL